MEGNGMSCSAESCSKPRHAIADQEDRLEQKCSERVSVGAYRAGTHTVMTTSLSSMSLGERPRPQHLLICAKR